VDPSSARYDRALTHLKKREYEQAVSEFTEVIRLAPSDPKAYVGRALAYRSLGEEVNALADESAAKALGTVERIRLVFISAFKFSEPTLLFYKPIKWPAIDPNLFVPLENLFRMLGETKISQLDIHEQPYIKVLGGLELHAHCDIGEGSWGQRQGIIRAHNHKQPRFDWVCTPSTWIEFAHLISGLVDSGGHQYLDCGPAEDAMVMISDGEYLDEEFEELHQESEKGTF